MYFKFVFYFLLSTFYIQSLLAQSNETIIKCAQDIESNVVEVRQQAAMILGKYEEPESTTLLLKHLNDTSPLVRRAVLVSLQDRVQKRLVGISYMAQIMDLLLDEDVEVRRLASTTAQFVISVLLSNTNYDSYRNNNNLSTINSKRVKENLLKALQDKDDMVRLNCLTTLSINRHLLFDNEFKNAVLVRISDNFKSIVVLALEILQSFSDIDIDSIAKQLYQSTETDICLALIRLMENRAYRNLEIFKKLAERNNLEIKSKALSVAIHLGIKELEPNFQAFITDNTNPTAQRIELVKMLPLLSQKRKILLSLLEDKSTSLKLECIQITPQILDPAELSKTLLKYLNDPAPSIQQETSNLLLQYLTEKDKDTIKVLFASENKNIRLKTLQKFLTFLFVDEDILIEAFMDSEKEIRLLAIKICAAKQLKNAEIKTILLRTLEDNDPDIQKEALHSLVVYLNEKEFLQACKNIYKKASPIIKTEIAISLRKNTSEDAKEILTTLANDTDAIVRKEASLSLYLLNDKTDSDKLIKMLLSQNLPIVERLKIVQTIFNNVSLAEKPFAILLSDPADVLRENALKFFNVHRDLYKDEYFAYTFQEQNLLNLKIACELYLNANLSNLETVTKMVHSTKSQLQITGYRVILKNYSEQFLSLTKEALASKDIDANYFAIEISRIHAIPEMATPIIDKLAQPHEAQLRTFMLWALLKINTENTKKYLSTITEKHPFYNDLLVATRRLEMENSRPFNKQDTKKR